MKTSIIPGILEKEWSEIEKKIELVKPFADTIHIDIIDGKFADNLTFLNPQPFKKYSKDLLFELHMMVENPIEYLKPWSEAGFKRFLGHIEKMPDQAEFVALGQTLGGVGLAIDGPTPLEKINIPISDLDSILIMSINAGFSGQKFMEEKMEKVRKLRESHPLLSIEVDGGVDNETVLKAFNAGANCLISTSYIFSENNPKKQYDTLCQKLNL